MFFKKKETKNVDILQQIKEKIDSDKKQSSASQKNKTKNIFDDDILSEIGVIGSDENKNEVVEDINEIVKNAVVSNDNEQTNFEDSLEEYFLNSTIDDFDKKNEEDDNDESNFDENAYYGVEEVTDDNDNNEIIDKDSEKVISSEIENQENKEIYDNYDEDEIVDKDNEENILVEEKTENSPNKNFTTSNLEENLDNNEIHEEDDNQKIAKLSDEELDALLSDLDEEQDNSNTNKEFLTPNKDTKVEENISDFVEDTDENDNNDIIDEDNDDEGIFDLEEDNKEEITTNNNDEMDFLNQNSSEYNNKIVGSIPFNNEMKDKSYKSYIENELAKELALDNNKNSNDNSEETNMFVKNTEEIKQESNKLQLDDVRSALVGANQNNLDSQHINQKTQDSVRKSIGELIENVKNQVLSEKAKTKQRIFEGKTVEQFMYDLIRPRVIEFLDNNLEQIVQDIVNQEIKHIIDGVEE